jgi:glycosyltransferase involved in cell wall biosynthesis
MANDTNSSYLLHGTDIVLLVKLAVFVPSLDTGGLSSLAKELGTAATLHGHEVILITHYSSQIKSPPTLRVENLSISPPRHPLFKPITAILRTLRAYFKIIRFRPDFVMCLDPSSAFICFMCRYLGLDFKLATSCFTPLPLLEKSDRAIIKFFYSRADRVIVPSTGSCAEIKVLNHKLEPIVIPNPYTSKALTCAWPNPENSNKNVIQFLGRLSPEKGVRLILKIAEANKDLYFRISGDGPEKSFLEAEISTLGLSNVELTGWLEPANCLPNSSMLVLPSKVESFGIVILEAWLHGLPVLAWSGASGPKELITKHGGGDLIKEFYDLDEWGRKIREQIHNPLNDAFISEIFDHYSGYQLIQEWLEQKTL